jgi:hypothetical protein
VRVLAGLTASLNAKGRLGLVSTSPGRCLAPRSGSCTSGERRIQGRGLPRARVCPSLVRRLGAATPLQRPVRGHSLSSRPPRISQMVLCKRRSGGDRASRRVWCSHTGGAPAQGNQVRIRAYARPCKAEKKQKPGVLPKLSPDCQTRAACRHEQAPALQGVCRALPVLGKTWALFGRARLALAGSPGTAVQSKAVHCTGKKLQHLLQPLTEQSATALTALAAPDTLATTTPTPPPQG